MTVDTTLRNAAQKLSSIVERPRLEAETLMAHSLRQERVWLHAHSGHVLTEEALEAFESLVQRRMKREPIEYITGHVSFYDLDLEVGPGVLIARPETELLVDMVSSIVEEQGIQSICEIGVGSGAVSIMLARKFPKLDITATDISADALGYAKKNIRKYGVEDRIRLVQTDLMEDVEGDFEMIVSNPPYIKESYTLPLDLIYEPQNALVGGKSGDEVLQRIIMTAKKRKIRHLICEMGYDQRESIMRFCEHNKLSPPTFYKDLAGLDRGFYLKLFT